MEAQIKIIGVVLILLAMLHVVFPKYFNWEQELKKLSLINREMMWIHTFFLALIVLLMGLLCVTSAEELVELTFGKRIALGFSIFWFIRLLVQFFGYSSKLWRGKLFETFVHVVFSIFWTYMSIVFFLTYLK